MKSIWILASLIFISFIIMQFNDPDPYIWVPVYLFPSVFCLLAAVRLTFNTYMRISLLVLTIVYSVWAMIIYPYGSGSLLDNEEFRESGGLLLSAITFILVYFNARRLVKIQASRPL